MQLQFVNSQDWADFERVHPEARDWLLNRALWGEQRYLEEASNKETGRGYTLSPELAARLAELQELHTSDAWRTWVKTA